MKYQFVFLLLLITLFSCNKDPESVTNAANNGTTVLGGNNFKQVSGTIAPGEYLELSHELTSFDYQAKFVHQNYIYDYRDYSRLFSPILSSPVQILPNKIIHEDIEYFLGWAPQSRISTERLSNGNIVVSANFKNDQSPLPYLLYMRIINSSGETIVEIKDIPRDERSRATALKEGGFVLAFIDRETQMVTNEDTQEQSEEVHHVLKFKIFSNAGSVIVPVTSTGLEDAAGSFGISPSGNGFFIYKIDNSKIKILKYSETGILLQTYNLDNESNNNLVMRSLSNGNFMAFYSAYSNETSTINASFYSDTGQLISHKTIVNDYIGGDGASVCISPNNNIFVRYESGGPDASSYVLFNQDGGILTGPRHLNNYEAFGHGCGTFGNNFAAIDVEDESLVAAMRIIKSDGALYPHEVIISDASTPTDYQYELKTLPISEKEMFLFYKSYQSSLGFLFHKVSPGMLELKATSDKTVRLYNYGAVSVPATISVIGSMSN